MDLSDDLYDSLPGTGWLSRPEAELLWATACACEGPVLEVGSFHGRSTCLLGATKRRVYAVDPFAGFSSDDPSGDLAWSALARGLLERKLWNVQVFRARIEEWQARPCGFAYLDGHGDDAGNYEVTASQIHKALACGVSAVGIHDCNDQGGGRGIRDAALAHLGPWQERVERLAVWRLK
jgi:hypothetical protein